MILSWQLASDTMAGPGQTLATNTQDSRNVTVIITTNCPIIFHAFTVRIELSDAEWENYNELYEEMENRGVSRTITSNSGVEYQLPDAEYNFEGTKTRSEILNLAKAASEETGKAYKILVTEAKGRTWYQLDRT